jgi:hypothetical protein
VFNDASPRRTRSKGGPVWTTEIGGWLQFSPATRGCSVIRVRTGVADESPCRLPRQGPAGGPPRRRGIPMPCAPRCPPPCRLPPTRGCSAGRAGSVVLPADAGVFRSSCRESSSSQGPPRRRGGVPSSSQ